MSEKKAISPENLKDAAGGYESPSVETTAGEKNQEGVIVVAPTVAPNTAPTAMPTATPVVSPVPTIVQGPNVVAVIAPLTVVSESKDAK